MQQTPTPQLEKFYVCSGNICWIVLAQDPAMAALRYVQNAMSDAVKSNQPITESLQLLKPDEYHVITQKFDAHILVSRAGYGRSEAGCFETKAVINRWLTQIRSLQNLIRKMA